MQSTNKDIRLFVAGDFCSKPSTSRIAVSDELLSLIQSCDLKVVNFEVPLKPENVHLPSQRKERYFQNDDSPDFLRKIGFNLFQLANNHTFDWGDEGFKKTKAALGDDSFGAGTYDEAYKVKVCEVCGSRIGFMSLTYAAYNGVFSTSTNHEGLGCAYINDLKVNHVIIEAKKYVDYLFVLTHDGIEYIDIPLPDTIARYRDLIDYGADGVFGTHSHCPQGWEEYKGKPIFYSLGNFYFNSKEGYDYRARNRQHWYEGLCVIMKIRNGFLSWEIVNTRNVDNLEIVLDHDDARDEHNLTVCKYLSNKEVYEHYVDELCSTLGQKDLSIIDKTFHLNSLKDCTKLLFKIWINKIRGRVFLNDYPLHRLITNDVRRDLLLLTLKRNNIIF